MKMYQVDSFAETVMTGNPAAVLVVEDWPSDALMQLLARENNLSETAFVKSREDEAWDLRWFAPEHEVAFCGHATLATAHILFTEHGARGDLNFHTRAGVLTVAVSGRGYALSLPILEPQFLTALPPEVASSFALPPVSIFRNFENIFVDLGTADAVRGFIPDLLALRRLGSIGLAITGREAEGAGAHFVSRYFAPGAGIPEDPVTGSTHSTLVPYWAMQLGRRRLKAYQASARGGWLDCELTDERVVLGGNAITFMEATLFL